MSTADHWQIWRVSGVGTNPPALPRRSQTSEARRCDEVSPGRGFDVVEAAPVSHLALEAPRTCGLPRGRKCCGMSDHPAGSGGRGRYIVRTGDSSSTLRSSPVDRTRQLLAKRAGHSGHARDSHGRRMPEVEACVQRARSSGSALNVGCGSAGERTATLKQSHRHRAARTEHLP